MNLFSLVWKEAWERPVGLLTSGLAIFLGVAALVAIQHVVTASESEVGRQMQSLGANVLILPKDATLENYYAADMQTHRLPESHVSTVLIANLPGVEKLSPKLCIEAEIGGRPVTLTGILPQEEFKAKAAWQSVSLFSAKHTGCKKACASPAAPAKAEDLAANRAIDELDKSSVILGAEVAESAALKQGAKITVLGSQFQVAAVLPRTGTIDDSRAFAHLHVVQELGKAGEVVSAIEVLGCCEDAAGQLVPELAKLLPDAKVVTISHVVQAQVSVNRLMGQVSLGVIGILVVVGAVSVAGAISANVYERRREIGTWMALGATPNVVASVFLMKAGGLGLVAGFAGAILGLVAAVFVGQQVAGTEVSPLVGTTSLAVVAAVAISLFAALWPARQAANLDPCTCFQEV